MKSVRRVLCVFLLVLALPGCMAGDDPVPIPRLPGVDLQGGTLVFYSDTHDGFLGDGETLAVIRFEREKANALARQMEGSGRWRALPMPQPLRVTLYGGWGQSPVFTNDSGESVVPRVENGYYYFWNRRSGCDNPADEWDLLDGYSYNFSVALYDTGQGVFYLYEVDT